MDAMQMDAAAAKFAGASSTASPVVQLYHLDNYGFGTKEQQREKDHNVRQRMERMERNYNSHGMRRSVDAVLLVHNHGHPHILLLQIGQSFFKLPGGRLRPGEDEILGLKRKLSKRLAAAQEELRPEWEVSDLISQWWRPHFEPLMYPYNPPHISRPKEYKKIFLVLLQEAAQFAVPSNLKLLAVPLFELYDNPGRYGPTIATLAQALSRFTFHCIPPPMTEGEAAEAAAQAAQQQQQPMDEEQQPAEQDQQTVKQEGEQSAAAAADSEQPTS